jgi:hypothetical protein
MVASTATLNYAPGYWFQGGAGMVATTSYTFIYLNKKSTHAVDYLDGEKALSFGGTSSWTSASRGFMERDTTPVSVTKEGHVVFRDPTSGNPHRLDGPAIALNTGARVWADQGRTTRVEFSDGETWIP